MSAFNTEDLKTEINTILNKSGESMEIPIEISPAKSSPRKSILKTPTISSFKEYDNKRETHEFLNLPSQFDLIPRPHTVCIQILLLREKKC